LSQQESEEDEDQEEQESPRRRRSIQESLSLPVPVCYPGNGQKGDPGERRDGSRSKAELSQGESAESSGSPSLSSPKDISSPHSPSGLMRNVKKREPKGKNKDSKGMRHQNVMAAALPVAFSLKPLLFHFRGSK